MSVSRKRTSSSPHDLRMFGCMTEKSLRALYSIGLGIVIVLFVGLAIATFYPAPEMATLANDPGNAARDAVRDAYRVATQDYNRNVTVIALLSALLVLGASIWSEAKNTVFAGGFLIGGLLTLIYGLMRGLTSGVTVVAFFSVTVGLVVIIYLGHQRFFSARAVAARAKAREDELQAMRSRMPAHPQFATQQPPAAYPQAPYQAYPEQRPAPVSGRPPVPYPAPPYPSAPEEPGQYR